MKLSVPGEQKRLERRGASDTTVLEVKAPQAGKHCADVRTLHCHVPRALRGGRIALRGGSGANPFSAIWLCQARLLDRSRLSTVSRQRPVQGIQK